MRNTLHLLVFTLSFVFCSLNLHSQWVSIPDSNFGKWLNTNGYNQCLQGNSTTGWQMDTTCNAVVSAIQLSFSDAGISDIEGIHYFDNLEYLYCDNNLLTDIPSLPDGLTVLVCSYNQLSNLPTLPGSLNSLDCSYNQLSTLPALPSGLDYLLCGGNPLNVLPVLPSNLFDLRCFDNQLLTLPPLPIGLTYLDCSNNQLTTLPALPSGLTTLACAYNQLAALPSLPSGLGTLSCGVNQLGSLPTLPSGLTVLSCRNNPLGTLPTLPNSLTILRCEYNQLSILPSLPSGLAILGCDGNQISILPTLPSMLDKLWCTKNQLSSLPSLPSGLNQLFCGNNLLTGLPPLPNSLTDLRCDSNQLTSLPELPDSLTYFYCYANPDLTCFPRLKKIKFLRFYNTGITCLPNYPVGYSSAQPSLNTVPLCGLFNNNGCPMYWNINGTAYLDTDSNCIDGVNETEFGNFKIRLYRNGTMSQEVHTTQSGGYIFDVDTFDTYAYTVDTSAIPFSLSCPDSGYYTSVLSVADSIAINMDFGLSCKSGFDLIAQSITASVFRPANNTPVNITAGDASNFYNAHCAAGISGSVTLTYTGPVQFVGAAPNALTPIVSGNTLTWNIADFGNINFFTDFNIVMHTDTNAQIGQQVCFTLTVNPIAGDNNPANNTLTICFPIVNSYDPNDKTAYPVGNIGTAQKELTYTIRFQNTGNAEAQHIYITDTLDTDVDASTFQLLAYSHQPIVQLKENAVRFNFPNINLPDSNTNEPASHGYVQYKVKLRPNLPIGTIINNTAYIYFDFNVPVITNTTTNTISLISSIGHSSPVTPHFTLFPNPANGNVTISIPESLIGSTVKLTDVMGRVVAAVLLTTQNSTLTTTSFTSGVYFITIFTTNGVEGVKKLVKE